MKTKQRNTTKRWKRLRKNWHRASIKIRHTKRPIYLLDAETIDTIKLIQELSDWRKECMKEQLKKENQQIFKDIETGA
jgi:hypothetical protein